MIKIKIVRYILGGDILIESFVVKQAKLIFLIVVLVVFFISNQYSCMKKLTEVELLKKQLQNEEYENLAISAEISSKSRLSQVEQLLQLNGIELSTPKTLVFELQR